MLGSGDPATDSPTKNDNGWYTGNIIRYNNISNTIGSSSSNGKSKYANINNGTQSVATAAQHALTEAAKVAISSDTSLAKPTPESKTAFSDEYNEELIEELHSYNPDLFG